MDNDTEDRMAQADIQKMANDGKLYALAYATLDLYRRVTSTPEGREMIERKKEELRAAGKI